MRRWGYWWGHGFWWWILFSYESKDVDENTGYGGESLSDLDVDNFEEIVIFGCIDRFGTRVKDEEFL